MIPMKRGQELHDRATRKLGLSDAEREDLKQWYAEMDAAEESALKMPPTYDLDSINAQIDETLASIQATTRKIIAVRRENQVIRKRIRKLENDIVRRPPPTM